MRISLKSDLLDCLVQGEVSDRDGYQIIEFLRNSIKDFESDKK